MSNVASSPPPAWFRIAAIVAVLWALAGVYACYTQLTLTQAQLSALPAAQRDAFSSMPRLISVAYIIAVAGGLAGSVLPLVRKRQARLAFLISLGGIIVQFGWVFLIYHGASALGLSAIAFPAFITGVCAAEIWLTGLAIRRGWTA